MFPHLNLNEPLCVGLHYHSWTCSPTLIQQISQEASCSKNLGGER